MRFDPKPLFRKLITPWYDSNIACSIYIGMMVCVLLFAKSGISVAMETPEYRTHLWVPVTLAVLSAAVALIMTIRLLIRRFHREPELKDE